MRVSVCFASSPAVQAAVRRFGLTVFSYTFPVYWWSWKKFFSSSDCANKATSDLIMKTSIQQFWVFMILLWLTKRPVYPGLKPWERGKRREERGLEIIRVKSDPLSTQSAARPLTAVLLPLINFNCDGFSPSPMLRNPLQLPRCEHWECCWWLEWQPGATISTEIRVKPG